MNITRHYCKASVVVVCVVYFQDFSRLSCTNKASANRVLPSCIVGVVSPFSSIRQVLSTLVSSHTEVWSFQLTFSGCVFLRRNFLTDSEKNRKVSCSELFSYWREELWH